jgi:hypothetical protein
MNKPRAHKSAGPKEIYVRVTPLPSTHKNEFNISHLKEQYDNEAKEFRSWNIFSGGGIGASVGLVACMTSSLAGIPVTSPEALTIVGGSLIVGIIAGFILY